MPVASPDTPADPTPPGFYRSRSGRLLPIVHQVSAGGLAVRLVNGKVSAALIERVGRNGRHEWLLPKGHVEDGETVPQAAAREVFEETGIESRPVRYLSSMDYWFSSPQKRVHKVVHLFLLDAIGGELSVAQDPTQEAIRASWVELSRVPRVLAFPAERRIAILAAKVLGLKA